MSFYSEEVSIPIGFLYAIVGVVGLIAVLVAAAFYKTRRYYEQLDLDLPPCGYDDCSSKKKVNWYVVFIYKTYQQVCVCRADSNLQSVVSLNAQSVQPNTSLRTKIKESLPWKSAVSFFKLNNPKINAKCLDPACN
jgi:hypothetical protein